MRVHGLDTKQCETKYIWIPNDVKQSIARERKRENALLHLKFKGFLGQSQNGHNVWPSSVSHIKQTLIFML